jgi:hypothetical protein
VLAAASIAVVGIVAMLAGIWMLIERQVGAPGASIIIGALALIIAGALALTAANSLKPKPAP